jgi:hypothetical protein
MRQIQKKSGSSLSENPFAYLEMEHALSFLMLNIPGMERKLPIGY